MFIKQIIHATAAITIILTLATACTFSPDGDTPTEDHDRREARDPDPHG